MGRPEVLRAVEEFDRLGRGAFLSRYGFQGSRTCLLVVGGRYYDSKAVALCPNCHAMKTRGRRRYELRSVFLDVVRERHRRTSATASA
ncbi:hypothetical protein AB0B50_27150 [Streptomyces sp. NPDC041068]|uniref:hypothetical protein n=1 Tax=Streptomyces sp. NPDC041068 TaxID=3155130 RepID=UPI0033DED3A5